MKQILVPTDFSESANNALNFAIESAKLLPAKITLLHSFEVNNNVYTDYMGVNREYNMSVVNDANVRLTKIKQEILEADGVDVDTVVSTESLYQAIANTGKEKNIDLVVMGTLGASGLKEKLWGSRTSSVIGKSLIPVMVIPLDYTWQKPEKIVFATNQFEKDPVILNYIFELTGLFMATAHITVFTNEDDDKASTFLNNHDKIQDYESYLKQTFNEDKLTSTHIIGEQFEETLQDFIKRNDVDILVMVTYQQKFWNRFFNPSKTKRMSYHTTIPLLAIPAGMKGEE